MALGRPLLGLDHDLVVALGVVIPAVGTLVEGVPSRVELHVPDFLAVDVHVAGLDPTRLLDRDASGVLLLGLGHALGFDEGNDLVLHGLLELEAVDRSHVCVALAGR